ncbi:MAG TPA: alpha/beta hydrolase [Kofleriaceae bacterium]|nr:alpha/beta hydrolase [Kofleriaceae bacterium]
MAIRSIHPIAPERATRLAARWFLTPARAAALGAARPRAIEDAQEAGARLEFSRGDVRLAAWSWGSGPPVLLVHGWNGRGQQLAAMARAIAARGHRAVVFDHPAHGDSSGRTVTIPEMARAIELVAGELGGVYGLVAHSLGGVAATLAISRGLSVTRAVFVAPPVRPEEWPVRFGRALGLPTSADAGIIAAIEARAGMKVTALRPTDLAPVLDTDLLIVHDRADREVPHADGEALARAWPGAQLVTTEGLGHKRLLSDPGTVELVASFIGGPLALAPRGSRRRLREPHLQEIVDQVVV